MRRIIIINRASHTSVDNHTILRIDIKSMNDTMRSNGLVPSLLAFGSMPTFHIPAHTNPTQTERFRAIASPLSVMETITAENRLK